MSEKILCTVKTWDGLAEALADEIAKKFKSHLEFWQATAMDDREEYAMWAERIRLEPDKVKERALAKIKSIMGKPQYNRKFYLKKYKIFVDWSTIRITPATGFYQYLLERDITSSFPVNVEYRIDMTSMNVVKITHSQAMKK
ncbi:MAG: hypothetical protein IJW20_00790 [Clostridia bacterium]|nr:hypothetical protein [Clostridia bacterium]